MARWKLTEAHYLKGRYADTETTEWQYTETDRVTGRQKTKRFEVPLYCDVGTIVCLEGSEYGDDNAPIGPIIFDGSLTPAMQPIDEEAKKLTEKAAETWNVHPIEGLPSNGYSDAILKGFEQQLTQLLNKIPTAPTTPAASGVSREEFDKLQQQLAELMAQNAELAKAKPERRKIG